MHKKNPLMVSDVMLKTSYCLSLLKNPIHSLSGFEIPEVPFRDIPILGEKSVVEKEKLSTARGQARLLHDLANIELQAMELGLRTLIEFPEAPAKFKSELISIILDERRHLLMCLNGVNALGFFWGDWPIHNFLWEAVSREDSLIDRILIVNRYLEGSGLDSGEMILKKLSGLQNKLCQEIVSVIQHEELSHVKFGSYWFRFFCEKNSLDPDKEFVFRMEELKSRIPRRSAKINSHLRTLAGFTPKEILHLQGMNLSH